MAVKKYALYLFIILTFLLFMELLLHYLFGHHIIDHIRKVFVILKKISSNDKKYKKIEEDLNMIDDSQSPVNQENDEYLNNFVYHNAEKIAEQKIDSTKDMSLSNINKEDKPKDTTISTPVPVIKEEDSTSISNNLPVPTQANKEEKTQ